MIGNDIIDLQLVKRQSNWQRPGFLEKQFTEREIQFIQDSKHPFQSVWRLWSMKEAVYKIVVQQFEQRFFAPKKLECIVFSDSTGEVVFQNESFQVRTESTAEYIYSVTGDSSFRWLNVQSELDFFKEVERNFGLSSTRLQIKKNRLGIPKLFSGDEQVSNSFTKTHHGRFEAIEYN